MNNPPGFEKSVPCPYNKSHQLLPHRVATHLIKCAKQYPGIKLEVCPFNSTHRLRKDEFATHKKECLDRGNFDHYINVIGVEASAREKMQHEVKAPKPNTKIPATEECWDHYDHPTYDPKKAAADKPVLRLTNGMTPSERRAFREQERRRLNGMENFV